jgi:hypothetical protein
MSQVFYPAGLIRRSAIEEHARVDSSPVAAAASSSTYVCPLIRGRRLCPLPADDKNLPA